MHALAGLDRQLAVLGLPTTAPRSTIVNSSNAGRCPGSAQLDGLRMRAMLSLASPVLTLPMNSSISFGRLTRGGHPGRFADQFRHAVSIAHGLAG